MKLVKGRDEKHKKHTRRVTNCARDQHDTPVAAAAAAAAQHIRFKYSSDHTMAPPAATRGDDNLLGRHLGRRRECGRRAASHTLLATTCSSLASLAALLCLANSLSTHFTQALAQTTTTTTTAQDHNHHHHHSNQQQQQHSASDAEAASRASNFLLFNAHENNTAAAQELAIQRLLKDVGHSHASDRVNISLANDVWSRMRSNALNYAQERVRQIRPEVAHLLEGARVSEPCKQSLHHLLDHIATLDEWAMRMYNSFGDFPATGLFEGSFTSMGSYHQCVNVAPNEWIGPRGPQYCSLIYQPVVPKRPVYHNILSKIDQLANFTSKQDMFYGMAQKSQYFYYTKLRFATCMPSKCAKSDLDAIGEQIALNTYLQFQGSQCLEKETGFNFDGTQLLALSLLFSLASISLLGTLVHLFNVRSLFDKLAPRRAATSVRSPLSSVPLSMELTSTASEKQHLQHHFEANNNNNNNNNSISLKGQVQGPPASAAGEVLVSLPPPAPSDISVSSSSVARSAAASSRALQVIDVLLHFSIIKNGKKLFDTSTSRRRGNSRAGSLVPGMREAAGGSSSSSDSSDTAASQSDASSVDGRSNDISCVHGLRFWTISWIIMGHTMQYTEWAGFGRAFQVEENITSLMLHPFLNATFSVDTFFLISGLLTTYVTWSITRGHYWRFNKFAFLISRYLRLLPQVLIVILIFIIYPQLGAGSSPWWRATAEKESQRCKQNWWVSALFLQSFYRSDQICNLVTWWLSVEMFYHFTSIFVIIALLHSARRGLLVAGLMGGGMTAYSCYLHYANAYPPNMLPTLLQRYEIWDSIVLKYFWTPYPHAPSYFVGLLLGYVLYNRSITRLTKRQVRYGWLAFAISYLAILFGTYHWNNNAPYSRFAATAYYNCSQVIWSLATGWAILACALGRGGWLNDFLSSPVFIPLGRATYMTYLSHMLIVMSYPAKMNMLIEPSYTVFLYIFISNLILSYALGICLTLVYESPILHLQKLLVGRMASRFNEEKAPKVRSRASGVKGHTAEDDEKAVRVSLYTQQQQQQQQQQQHNNMQATTVMIDTTGCH